MADITKIVRRISGPVQRVTLSMPPALLRAVDRQAKAEYGTRSDLMRRALLEYLRAAPDHKELHELITDPEELERIIRQRRLRVSLRKMLNDMKR